MIQLFDQSFATPEENLACDEALLDFCEETQHPGFLRFWESSGYFVTLGYGKKLGEEVKQAACEAMKVPVLRRISGGGTVLQGPGSFNYALILPIAMEPGFEMISSTNQQIMERNRGAMERLVSREVSIQGHTDLVVGDRKFSGNAQRRKRNYFLFHGAFLLSMDLDLMSQVLALPKQQPEYRQQREHRAFLMNLQVPAERVKEVLRDVWKVGEDPWEHKKLEGQVQEKMSGLILEKYGSRDWNQKF